MSFSSERYVKSMVSIREGEGLGALQSMLDSLERTSNIIRTYINDYENLPVQEKARRIDAAAGHVEDLGGVNTRGYHYIAGRLTELAETLCIVSHMVDKEESE